MMRYRIIGVGRLKEDYYKKISAEYEKRLTQFCKLEIIEINAAKISADPSEKEILNALEKEAVDIISLLPKNVYVIALCIEGGEYSGKDFAEKLRGVEISKSEICFVIGGSHGLANAVKERADLKLSMSAMTFTHRLARIMLLEQLYRSFMIDRKYNK